MSKNLGCVRRPFGLVTIVLCFAGCSAQVENNVINGGTRVITPVSSGSDAMIPLDLSSERNGVLYDPNVGEVAFVIGLDGSSVVGAAGISDPANVGSELIAEATYTTNYKIFVTRDIGSLSGANIGVVDTYEGPARFSVDFQNGTVTWENDRITASGQFHGTQFTAEGTLPSDISNDTYVFEATGQLGQDAVIGTVLGQGTDYVLAGGLLGTTDGVDP